MDDKGIDQLIAAIAHADDTETDTVVGPQDRVSRSRESRQTGQGRRSFVK
jgi:hypothetical protein